MPSMYATVVISDAVARSVNDAHTVHIAVCVWEKHKTLTFLVSVVQLNV